MNWLVMILAFAVAVMTGGFLAGTLARSRAGWSARRRKFTAAAALPLFLLLLTAAGVVFVFVSGPGEGENMQDLAVAATLVVGGVFAFTTFIGGMVGASLSERREQP